MAVKQIQAQSLQSLMLTMRFNGTDLSTGTGFIVETPIGPGLVTNRHNVTGKHQDTGKHLSTTLAEPNEIAIYHLQACDPSKFIPAWTEVVEPLYNDDGTARWKEHPQLGGRADFVLLPLSNLHGISLMPYALDAGKEIAIGPAETVSVIGFPFGKAAGGRFGVWATGFLASEPEVNYNELPLLLIDCRTRQGQSGSPVIALRSGAVGMVNGDTAMYTGGPVEKFIGIYSGRINNESDIGMVWKASAIAELVRSLAPPSPPDYRYRLQNR